LILKETSLTSQVPRVFPTMSPQRSAVRVTENCLKCKYTDEVEVLPGRVFTKVRTSLVIDPRNARLHAVEHGVQANAIFPEDDVTRREGTIHQINAELSKAWPVMTNAKMHLPTPRIGRQGGQGLQLLCSE